jgi:hypothetical protein
MGERFKELPTPHLSFTALFITWMTEIKLDINLLSKTNKYKTKQTNQKYQKERQKPNLLSI